MTGSVTVSAPAKINLCLGVGAVRDDGFHSLATVYQAIDIRDEVTVTVDDGVSVSVEGVSPSLSAVPTDESNIACRAALALAEHAGSRRGVAISITKSIPVAGGLAGGSADAAATLLACDRLWGLATPREELLGLAAELGSDVPFALVGGTAIGSGRGEVVTPVVVRGDYWWVVLESAVGLSTPAVYREFDAVQDGPALSGPEAPEIADSLLHALSDHDVEKLGATLSNDLQPAALRLRPELRDVLDRAVTSSVPVLGSLLSGSGPSCLYLCDGRESAVLLARELSADGLGPVQVAAGPARGAHVTGEA